MFRAQPTGAGPAVVRAAAKASAEAPSRRRERPLGAALKPYRNFLTSDLGLDLASRDLCDCGQAAPVTWTRHTRRPECPAHRPHSSLPAKAALRYAIPARHPLLPGMTGSLRCACVIPTSPPPRGGPEGEVGITPAPLLSRGEGLRLIQKHIQVLSVRMLLEGASKTSADDRGRCSGRRASRGPREYSAVATAPGKPQASGADVVPPWH